jgi:hypothetical protein
MSPWLLKLIFQLQIDLLSNNWKGHSVIKLGAFYFDVKHDVMTGLLAPTADMPSKFTIIGAHLRKKLQHDNQRMEFSTWKHGGGHQQNMT